MGKASDIAKPYQIYVKQRYWADVNSPYKRKCWTNSVVPLCQSLLLSFHPKVNPTLGQVVLAPFIFVNFCFFKAPLLDSVYRIRDILERIRIRGSTHDKHVWWLKLNFQGKFFYKNFIIQAGTGSRIRIRNTGWKNVSCFLLIYIQWPR